MSCDVGKATEGLANELWCQWSDGKVGEWAPHSPTFPSLHLRHSSFSNSSVALLMSQLILQSFCCFTYVTMHSPALLSLLLRQRFSLTSPGEPPMTLTLLIPPRQNNYLRPWSSLIQSFSIPYRKRQFSTHDCIPKVMRSLI